MKNNFKGQHYDLTVVADLLERGRAAAQEELERPESQEILEEIHSIQKMKKTELADEIKSLFLSDESKWEGLISGEFKLHKEGSTFDDPSLYENIIRQIKSLEENDFSNEERLASRVLFSLLRLYHDDLYEGVESVVKAICVHKFHVSHRIIGKYEEIIEISKKCIEDKAAITDFIIYTYYSGFSFGMLSMLNTNILTSNNDVGGTYYN